MSESMMLGEIFYQTKDKKKAHQAEKELKKSGYHSIITVFKGGLYTVKGFKKP